MGKEQTDPRAFLLGEEEEREWYQCDVLCRLKSKIKSSKEEIATNQSVCRVLFLDRVEQ